MSKDSTLLLVEDVKKLPADLFSKLEFEYELGTHCGKFKPGIPKNYHDHLRQEFALTDQNCTFYVDFFCGSDIRVRRQLPSYEAALALAREPMRAMAKSAKPSLTVTQKTKWAHNDYTIVQRNNLGARLWARGEEVIADTDVVRYPACITSGAFWRLKRCWSIPFADDPAFRLDFSIVLESGAHTETYEIESELQDRKQLLDTPAKDFVRRLTAPMSMIVNHIAAAFPEPVRYLFVVVSTLTNAKKRKSDAGDSEPAPKRLKPAPSKDDPTTPYTPSNAAVVLESPGVQLSKYIESKSTVVGNLPSDPSKLDLFVPPASSAAAPQPVSLQQLMEQIVAPAGGKDELSLPDDGYTGTIVTWLFVSHSQGAYVTDKDVFSGPL